MERNIIILSEVVYDRLYYKPFTRIATLSPELSRLTITVGSAGKCFYATGWCVSFDRFSPAEIIYLSMKTESDYEGLSENWLVDG